MSAHVRGGVLHGAPQLPIESRPSLKVAVDSLANIITSRPLQLENEYEASVAETPEVLARAEAQKRRNTPPGGLSVAKGEA